MISNRQLADNQLGSLGDILGLHVRLAHGAIQRHFAENFGSLGLTQKQISVLWLVGDHPGTAQTDLAARLQMDRATTMTIVHALEKGGLLARSRGQGDARRIAFMLTDAGADALVAAKTAIAQHEAWLRDRVGEGDVDGLIALLRRVHD